jgi:hypothetical protein
MLMLLSRLSHTGFQGNFCRKPTLILQNRPLAQGPEGMSKLDSTANKEEGLFSLFRKG